MSDGVSGIISASPRLKMWVCLHRNKNVFIWKFVKDSWIVIRRKGRIFLCCILACDEMWVHHYTPESKQANMECGRKGKLHWSRLNTLVSWKGALWQLFVTLEVFFDRFSSQQKNSECCLLLQASGRCKVTYHNNNISSQYKMLFFSMTMQHTNASLH